MNPSKGEATMTLTNETLIKLTAPKPGPHTTRLPGKAARTNAALIAAITRPTMPLGQGAK